MALIDIPKRVEDYIVDHGSTPPCFAVALDAVTGGYGIPYEKFDEYFPPGVNLVEQEMLLEECFPGDVWQYSPIVVRLVAGSKVTEANERVAKQAAQQILAKTTVALVISEPGSKPGISHARAITPARPGTAIIWDSKSNPLIRVVGEAELKQTLVDCLGRPENHLFAIGFRVLLQDLL